MTARSLSKYLVIATLALLGFTPPAFAIPIGADLQQAKTLSFVYPLMGSEISSAFGVRRHPVRKMRRHHAGVDLAAPKGAPIRTVRSGVVVFADPYQGYGNLIVVQHEKGVTSHYGHCDTIVVKPGAHVKAGQVLGTVGTTGVVTGPHLHLELRINGVPQNPEIFFPGLGLKGVG